MFRHNGPEQVCSVYSRGGRSHNFLNHPGSVSCSDRGPDLVPAYAYKQAKVPEDCRFCDAFMPCHTYDHGVRVGERSAQGNGAATHGVHAHAAPRLPYPRSKHITRNESYVT
nr:hypothetical protein StreXyl84_74010 [Streptomyces sp. Xyl84]